MDHNFLSKAHDLMKQGDAKLKGIEYLISYLIGNMWIRFTTSK